VIQENQDVAAARNRGAREARGVWIAFLDQDDFFLPEKLALQVAAAVRNPNAAIVHGGWQITDADGVVRSSVEPWHGIPTLDLEAWLLWKPVFLGAMLLERRCLEESGEFNVQYHQASDVELILRLAVAEVESVWVPQVVVGYRQHQCNVSHNILWEAEECELILCKLFQEYEEIDRIKKLEQRAKYINLVRSAWRFFSVGNDSQTLRFLKKSLIYSNYCKVESFFDWQGQFEKYNQEYGLTTDLKKMATIFALI
jgi:glycosyltransferase involved in cell wall biosynthesis